MIWEIPIVVMASEFLRAKQRVDQVGEQKECRDSGDDVIHFQNSLWTRLGHFLQAIADLSERPARHKKQSRDQDVSKIEHGGSSPE